MFWEMRSSSMTRMVYAIGFSPPRERLNYRLIPFLYIRDAGEAENLALYFKKVVFPRKNPEVPP